MTKSTKTITPRGAMTPSRRTVLAALAYMDGRAGSPGVWFMAKALAVKTSSLAQPDRAAALQSLLKSGFVERRAEDPLTGWRNYHRWVYRITEAGRVTLAALDRGVDNDVP